MKVAQRVLRQAHGAGWIEIWDHGSRRSLWFDDTILQTEIDRLDPGHLPNRANRAMLAHLLFGQQPERVLLAGCGGGGIARWFHARSPAVHGVAAEISPAIARIAQEWFEFPGPQSNWRLQLGDVRDWLATTTERYDFILFDLEEQQHTPAWVTSTDVLGLCRERLRADGVLTLNLIADHAERFALALGQVRQAFAQRVLCLPVPGHDNVIVLAFMAPPRCDDPDQACADAAHQWGLEFAQFLARMRRANPPGSGLF